MNQNLEIKSEVNYPYRIARMEKQESRENKIPPIKENFKKKLQLKARITR